MDMKQFDGLRSLATMCRTVRRYKTDSAPTREELLSFVDIARISPSAANRQRLLYKIISDEEAERVFSMISLGGYLPEDERPTRDMRPTGYIVILAKESEPDTNLAIDIGIAAESIVLAACEAGYGSCMIRSFKREGILSLIKAEGLTPHLVIAFGKASECARIIPMKDGDVRYYRDGGCNLVPKRDLCDIVVD